MKSILMPGKPGGGAKILYGATLDLMKIGIAKGQEGFYPSIDLFYPLDVLSKTVMIAKEMERQNQSPKVFIDQTKAKPYVAVVFSFKLPDFNFLKKILPMSDIGQIDEKFRGEILELIMTGEAESASKDLTAFLKLFGLKQYFLLSIAEGQGKRSIIYWSATLTSFEDRLPMSGQ